MIEEEVDVHYQLRYDNAAKAQAFDRLLADIRNGVIKIVPVEENGPMLVSAQVGLLNYPHADAQDVWQAMIQAAPEYTPLKDWLQGTKPTSNN